MRVNRPRFLVTISAGLLFVYCVLQLWKPSWYGVTIGSFLLGSFFMVLFFTLMSVLFDACWPTRVDKRSRH